MSGRVLVIGAGASGLTAIKELREQNLDVVCFEMMDYIGGLWKFTEHEAHSSVYRTTVINTSKEMTAYSDFPVPKDFPSFMGHSKIIEYLEQYARNFNLFSSIKFKHKVIDLSPSDDHDLTGRWTVKYQVDEDSEIKQEEFDYIIVSSGHHWKSRIPEFKGLEKFQGSYIHSHAYKDHKGFENKNVAVVGIGNSGVDVAVELSRHAKQVYLSTRSGAWILHRLRPDGYPMDYFASRISVLFPLWVKNLLLKSTVYLNHDLAKYGLKPKFEPLSAHPTINGELCGRIATGTVKVRPNIQEIKENSILFENGVEDPIDCIVFSTGYSISFPFLNDSCKIEIKDNHVNMYKYVFPPIKHQTIAFIGLVQPWGSIMPLSEIQSRWIAQVFAKKIKLPSREKMEEDIQKKRAEMAKRYKNSPRHTIQVDYTNYMEEVAEIIQVVPSFWKIFIRDPKLALATLFGPAVPPIYRITGNGSWKGAPHAVKNTWRNSIFGLGTNPDKLRRGNLLDVIKFIITVYIVYQVLKKVTGRK